MTNIEEKRINCKEHHDKIQELNNNFIAMSTAFRIFGWIVTLTFGVLVAGVLLIVKDHYLLQSIEKSAGITEAKVISIEKDVNNNKNEIVNIKNKIKIYE